MSAEHPSDQTLEDYVLDFLDAEEAAAVREHVRGCPACEARLAREQAVEEGIAHALDLHAEQPVRSAEAVMPVVPDAINRSWTRGLVLAAVLLLAPVVALRQGGPEALPDYAMTVSGGQRAVRAAEPAGEGPVVLAPGNRLEVRLRPDHATPPPEVGLFRRDGASWERLPAEVTVAPEGAAAIAIRATAEVLPEGEHALWAAACPVGYLGEAPTHASCRLLPVTVRVAPLSSPEDP